ncbi:MAG TPA: alpha-1,2-fucosyltransferase [Flavisolibacter sp.]|nr:alpha-1,2-fucosyltransferase [Flavisolibacter sp.]
MIIIRIIGGLGNQLFQYAAARCLAELKGTEVKLDVAGFQDYQLRNFDLTAFNIKATIASEQEIALLKPKGTIERVQSYLTPLRKRRFYKQPYFHYDPNFHQLGNNVYLQGFFQSKKYFTPIQSIIRKELKIRNEHIKEVKQFGNTLQTNTSVALHIRRGDYKNEEALRYHGIVPIEYYQQAASYFQQKLSNPKFYIFSDDGNWVKENLQLANATIVSSIHSKTHFEDLYLMSQCQHNIIANSSFSWWGAWLNNNSDKIVIAPKQWFNEGPKDTQDLCPTGWVTL